VLKSPEETPGFFVFGVGLLTGLSGQGAVGGEVGLNGGR
jgi:hypothetical protein